MDENELEQIEIDLIISAVYTASGYDFRDYAGASLRRRLHHLRQEQELSTLSELIPLVLHDQKMMEKLVYIMSITVTEMFRDPEVFSYLRKEIIPYLKTFPFLRIWVAGCATGEEVYSLAVMLKEEGLYERSQIYATDYNALALEAAEQGIYPQEKIREYMENYRKSGGRDSLSAYFHSQYESVIMDASLKKNVTFASHNLAVDGSFSEMNLILCRNVMIYFNKTLQGRVLNLFRESLCPNGFLCLGKGEGIRFSGVEDAFETLEPGLKIYKRLAL